VPDEYLPTFPDEKYFVDNWGGDPTGAVSSDAAITAILADMGVKPATIVFGPGNYQLTTTINIGPYQSIEGDSRGATILEYKGSGDCIRMQDTRPYINVFAHDPGGAGGPGWAGHILDLTVRGTDSGVSGLHIGDIARARVRANVIGFTNGIGVWLHNTLTWFEKALVDVHLINNKEGAVFQCDNYASGGPSFGYGEFVFHVVAFTDQTGVRLGEGVLLYNLAGLGFNLTGGFANNSNATANTGAVLKFDNNARLYCHGNIEVESNGNSGYPGHKTIVNSGGAMRFSGDLNFENGGPVTFQPGTTNPAERYNLAFAGKANVDSFHGHTGLTNHMLRINGGFSGMWGDLSATGKWKPLSGNWFQTNLAAGANTFTVDTAGAELGKYQAASFDLFLSQPASGGPSTLTWPSSFTWAEGQPPQLSTAPSTTDWIRVSTINFVTFYAVHVNSTRTVTVAGTQTLTAKTLTNPRINGELRDVNGASSLIVQANAGAVNSFLLGNAGLGGAPRIAAVGTDTNIGFNLSSKGTGGFGLRHSDGSYALLAQPIAGSVNYTVIEPGLTGQPAKISVMSSADPNVSLNIASRNLGVVQINGTQAEVKGHTHTVAQVAGARSWAAVPANATAPGTAGQEAYDADFHYVCVAANVWKRTPLTTW
jgi:hypothetical protein